jgi:alcohol dehydrogenase (cytochrome c)
MRTDFVWRLGVLAAMTAALMLSSLETTFGATTPRTVIDDRALADERDGRNWAAYGRTYSETHYSPLDQVNADTIIRLGLAWTLDLEPQSVLSTPLAVDGVIYLAVGYSVVHAVDARTGKLLWRYDPGVTQRAGAKLRTGWGTRGLAYWKGRVFVGTHDGRLLAIDATTGQPAWTVQVVDRNDGSFITGPPRVFDDKVVIGFGGADFGPVRGYVTAYDTATGKQLWRKYTIPARGEKGNETWPQDNNAWELGGGSAWVTGSYDPELDLMFWGTGNPAPWASQTRAGDNLYTSSVLAMRPKTGEIVWHYQFTPNDAYDYDACWELINAELNVSGEKRKVIMQFNRNGFLYAIDRANGKLVAANPFEKVNWATHIDKETGRPVETELAAKLRQVGNQVELWPTPLGAKNWPHAAYSPETGLLYANTQHQGALYKHLETKPFVVGQRYMYIERLPVPNNGGEPWGHIDAVDPLTGKQKWRVPLTDHPIWSANLVTGGGLLFTGKETGEFIALDIEDGKQVWQFQTGSGINAQPITYTHNGKQYVTVLSGIGGLYWNVARDKLKDKVPQGGSVWTFAVLPD